MIEHQIELVQKTWFKVEPISVATASIFYGRLMEKDRSLKRIFYGTITVQGKHIMQGVGSLVRDLREMDKLQPTLRKLRQWREDFEITEAQYEVVLEAWLWSLDKTLGPDYTHAVREAWTEAFRTLLQFTQAPSSMDVPRPTPVPA